MLKALVFCFSYYFVLDSVSQPFLRIGKGMKVQIISPPQLLSIYIQYYSNNTLKFYLLVDWQTTFHAPVGNDPIVLNLGSMGKGLTWVNGQCIGRYWVSFLTPKGTPSQQWYVPMPQFYFKFLVPIIMWQNTLRDNNFIIGNHIVKNKKFHLLNNFFLLLGVPNDHFLKVYNFSNENKRYL